MCFPSSPHVAHYRYFPKEYAKHVQTFVLRSANQLFFCIVMVYTVFLYCHGLRFLYCHGLCFGALSWFILFLLLSWFMLFLHCHGLCFLHSPVLCFLHCHGLYFLHCHGLCCYFASLWFMSFFALSRFMLFFCIVIVYVVVGSLSGIFSPDRDDF